MTFEVMGNAANAYQIKFVPFLIFVFITNSVLASASAAVIGCNPQSEGL